MDKYFGVLTDVTEENLKKDPKEFWKGVTSIGNGAFYRCDSLQSIVIPDGVTSIGDCAFESCKSLRTITIGNDVEYIGNYAFLGCKSLENVTIGNGVTSIGDCAFYGCKLKSVTIPDNNISIGYGAFDRHTKVERRSPNTKLSSRTNPSKEDMGRER